MIAQQQNSYCVYRREKNEYGYSSTNMPTANTQPATLAIVSTKQVNDTVTKSNLTQIPSIQDIIDKNINNPNASCFPPIALNLRLQPWSIIHSTNSNSMCHNINKAKKNRMYHVLTMQ